MDFQYLPKNENQLKNWYNEKLRNNKIGFSSLNSFFDWYGNQIKECHYCGIKEIESQELIIRGLLTSNRFPLDGKITQGRSRAMWLEIDKKDPKGIYSKDNSVLCCYFCNNDKSDVFHADAYKLFVQDRPAYLRSLLKNDM